MGGMENFARIRVMSGNGEQPTEPGIWKKAVEMELSAEERAKWQKELDARKRFQEKTIVVCVLSELDRMVSLRREQWEKLEAAIGGIIAEYKDEIPRYFSFGENGAWYLQTYTRLMPLAGVPEAEMKATLGKAKWDRWSSSHEFANANSYWNNIKQMHDNIRRR
jgi:hypothetical protein